jgi:hypothetical protein
MTRVLSAHSGGAVMAEMLAAFPPVLLMFLAVAQASLLSVGQLVVRHAAQRAARTAIVVLEDDPARYGGQARGVLQASSPPPTGAASVLPITRENTSVERLARALIDRDRSRLNAIRAAAYLPLALIAPAAWLIGRPESLQGALDHSLLGQLTSGLIYNVAGAAITFPTSPGSEHVRTSAYGPSDLITVRVTYLFRCEVPIAAAVMCEALGGLLLGAVKRDVRQVEAPALQALLALRSGRYSAIAAEATLPIQGARYYARRQ